MRISRIIADFSEDDFIGNASRSLEDIVASRLGTSVFSSHSFLTNQNGDSRLSRATLAGDLIEVDLTRNDARHLQKVLRIEIGDSLEIVDSQTGVSFTGELREVSSSSLELKVNSFELPKRPLPICAIVGLGKSSTTDFIVEKCIELGVNEFVFFVADRTQGIRKLKDLEQRCKRLARVAEAATKQSGALSFARIVCASSLEDALIYREELRKEQAKIDTTTSSSNLEMTRVILHPEEMGAPLTNSLSNVTNYYKSLRQTLADNKSSCSRGLLNESITEHVKKTSDFTGLDQGDGKAIALQKISLNPNHLADALEQREETADFHIVVGPEGGLTRVELDLAREHSYQPVFLGPRVLKTETAVIVACGYVALAL